jgi:hypothetical protein
MSPPGLVKQLLYMLLLTCSGTGIQAGEQSVFADQSCSSMGFKLLPLVSLPLLPLLPRSAIALHGIACCELLLNIQTQIAPILLCKLKTTCCSCS